MKEHRQAILMLIYRLYVYEVEGPDHRVNSGKCKRLGIIDVILNFDQFEVL